ncbi:MAG: hypothetical protein IKL89_08315 [Clostridia bacterium]|nr:hypothetical protein [Clostridia bacterium]
MSATPEATPTPVPTKKPTTAPTPKPTAAATPTQQPVDPQETLNPWGRLILTYEPDELIDVLNTADAAKLDKGQFAQAVETARSNGYIYMPKIGGDVKWELWKTALNSPREKISSGLVYRVSYKGVEAMIYILDVDTADTEDFRSNTVNYMMGVKSEYPEEMKAGIRQKELLCDKEMRDCYEYPVQNGEKQRIYFRYDDTHLIAIDWFTKSPEVAEAYMAALEFEKVELKTGKPILPSTPITPNA